MEIIFLLGAVQAFFFGFLLIGKGNQGLHHRLLFFFFCIIGLVLTEHFLLLKGVVFSFPHLLGVTYTLPIILGPILFFYSKSLIGAKDAGLFKGLLIHALPFLLFTLYFIYDYYFLDSQGKLDYYLRETQMETSMVVYLTEVFLNFSVPLYSIASLILLKNHLKQVKQNFSNILHIDLHWLKVVLLCMLFISFVSVLMGLLSDTLQFISYWHGDNALYLSLTIVIYFLGYYGIKQNPVLVNAGYAMDQTAAASPKTKYAKSSLKEAEKAKYTFRLTNYMDEKKPYLAENLTLKELADKLEILPNTLSQIINEGFNKNFYEYVNEYRVEEVKRMLSDPKYAHYSLLGIAFECGFSSKSTFNSVFKQYTGKTPSAYRVSVF